MTIPFSPNILKGKPQTNKPKPKSNLFHTPGDGTLSFILYEKEALQRHLIGPRGYIWESFCGNGAITKVLRQHHFDVIETDIRKTRSQPGGVDFLKVKKPLSKVIVSNPAYDEFPRAAIRHAKKIGVRYVAFLLKADFFNSEKNAQILESEYSPSRIYALDWRLDFTGQGRPIMNCIWVVIDGWEGKPPTYHRMMRPDRYFQAYGEHA